MIEREEPRPGITLLRMAHGKANALDLEFLRALKEACGAIDTAATRAVVLTGRGTIFSAGVDLYRVLDGGRAYVDEFLPALSAALSALAFLPLPVVCAVNGHAIAGGCILACCGDRVLMADGPGRIGVPELLVGVPFPTLALELVRAATTQGMFRQMVYSGRTLTPAEAVAAGLADRHVPADEVESAAVAAAEELTRIPQATFALSKKQLRQPVRDRVQSSAAAWDREVARLWQGEPARARMREYVEQTLKKKG